MKGVDGGGAEEHAFSARVHVPAEDQQVAPRRLEEGMTRIRVMAQLGGHRDTGAARRLPRLRERLVGAGGSVPAIRYGPTPRTSVTATSCTMPSAPAISSACSTATREERVPFTPQTMRSNAGRTPGMGPRLRRG